MRTSIAVGAGAALGVMSRIEETTDGFWAGISTDSTWIATAFLAGSAVAGAGALTAANVAYYAWIVLTEPGRHLAEVAGPVAPWFALGIAGGAVFGALGRAWRAGVTLAVLPLAAVVIVDVSPLDWLP